MEDPADDSCIVARVVASTQARVRRPDYALEVRALLDAARSVIVSSRRARVSDIVAEAGLSNDAFYRHFPSKDALVAALVEEGAERIARSVGRRMSAQSSPEMQIRCWLDGMLEQADEPKATETMLVLGASSNFNTSLPTGVHLERDPMARLLHAPLAQLGSDDAHLDAELVTHAVLSRVAGHLHAGTRPSARERRHLIGFCLGVACKQF